MLYYCNKKREAAKKKLCSKCGKTKDATTENFYIDAKTGKLKSVCKECRRVYGRERQAHKKSGILPVIIEQ